MHGQLGIAMPGHHEDGPVIQDNLCVNHGNYLVLLKFRIQARDTVLQDNLFKSAGNAFVH